jgi:hypothetical protein
MLTAALARISLEETGTLTRGATFLSFFDALLSFFLSLNVLSFFLSSCFDDFVLSFFGC